MKKCKLAALAALLVVSFTSCMAQTTSIVANKVEIKDSIKLGGKWYHKMPDSIGGGGSLPDTAAMLSPYLRKGDTASMLNAYLKSSLAASTYATITNLALKLNISDTAGMLSSYLHKGDTAGMLNAYLKSSLAASTYATITNLALKLNLSDTAGMLSNYLHKADTAGMLNAYLKTSLAASTYATITNLALKVNLSDTATMLSKYLRKGDTASMLNAYLKSSLAASTYATLTSLALKLNASDTAHLRHDVDALADSLDVTDTLQYALPLYVSSGPTGDTVKVRNDSAAWNANALNGIPITGNPANGQTPYYDESSNSIKYKTISGGAGQTDIAVARYSDYDSVTSSTGTGGRVDTADATHAGLESRTSQTKLTHPLVVKNDTCTACLSLLHANGDTMKAKVLDFGRGIDTTGSSQERIKARIDSNWIAALTAITAKASYSALRDSAAALRSAIGSGGTGIADPGANGMLSRTGSNTVTPRTMTGTANRIVVTNGDGVGGNPTYDIGTDVVTLNGSQIISNKTIGVSQLSGQVDGAHGGTGVNNSGKTLTLGGNLSTVGAFTVTLTFSNNTSITFPASGTVFTTATTGALATGLLKNTNGTGALSIAAAGSDYAPGTASLGTGIVKNTTGTGALSIATAADFPILNQNTTGTAAGLSGTPALPNGTTATTQSAKDSSNKLSTTAYSDRAAAQAAHDSLLSFVTQKLLFAQTSSTTLTNSSDQTSMSGTGFGSRSYAAGFWHVGKTVRIRVAGVYSTPSSTTGYLLPMIVCGGVTMAYTQITSLPPNVTNGLFEGEITITCLSEGTIGTVQVDGTFKYATGEFSSLLTGYWNNSGSTASINTTSSGAFDFTAQWGIISSAYSITCTSFIVESLN